MRSDVSWLGKKITNLQNYVGDYLDRLCLADYNCSHTSPELLMQTARKAATTMMDELSTFAREASLSPAGKRTTLGALGDFIQGSVRLQDNSTREDVSLVLEQLDELHSTLKQAGASSSQAKKVGAQLSKEAQKMSRRVHLYMSSLGVFRKHGNVTRQAQMSWKTSVHKSEVREALLNMDRLWWPLRESVDQFLDVSEREIQAYQNYFDAMDSYEHCADGVKSVARAYGRSAAAKERAAETLGESWRKTTNLMGEMASVLDDGSVFDTLIKAQGCESQLAQTTLLQVQNAVTGIDYLKSRFQGLSMRSPDQKPLQDAIERIKSSYFEATKGCKKGLTEVAPKI